MVVIVLVGQDGCTHSPHRLSQVSSSSSSSRLLQEQETTTAPTSLGGFILAGQIFVLLNGSDDFFTAPEEDLAANEPLSEGQTLYFAVAPATVQGGFALTTEIDLLAFESCTLWIDSSPTDLVLVPDPGEPQLALVGADDGVVSDAVNMIECGEREAAAFPGISVCVLAVDLPADDDSEFFAAGNETLVSLTCDISMVFQGDGTRRSRRRHLQTDALTPGQEFTLSSSVSTFSTVGNVPDDTPIDDASVDDNNEDGGDDSCIDGCFFLLCWFRFVFCWIIRVFG